MYFYSMYNRVIPMDKLPTEQSYESLRALLDGFQTQELWKDSYALCIALVPDAILPERSIFVINDSLRLHPNTSPLISAILTYVNNEWLNVSEVLLEKSFFDFEYLSLDGILIKGRIHRLVNYVDPIDEDNIERGTKEIEIIGVNIEFKDQTKVLRERSLTLEFLLETGAMTFQIEFRDGVSRLTARNGHIAEYSGAEVGDIVGLSEAIHPDDRIKVQQEISKITLDGLRETTFEVRLINYKEEVIWTLIKLKCDDPSAKRKIIRGFATDINDIHLQRENEARRSALLEIALNLNSVQNYTISFDADDNPIIMSLDIDSQGGEWGDKEDTDEFEALHLDPFFRSIHPDDRIKAIDAFRELKKGIPIKVALRLRTKDNKTRTVENYAIPVAGENGNFNMAIGGFIDVTDVVEKGTLDILIKFLTMFTHDFKAPLTAINNSIELLSRDVLQMNETQRTMYESKKAGWVELAKSMVKQLADSVQTMLRLVTSQAGGNEMIKLNEVNLSNSLKKIIDECCLQNSDHKFNIDIPDTKFSVRTDELLLKHIIGNLVSNACKYSPDSPSIDITMETLSSSYRIAVVDHGIGIPPEDQAKTLNQLGRASNVSDISGTGIGLVMVNQIAQLLDCKITFESTLNVGTTFFVEIPFVENPVPIEA